MPGLFPSESQAGRIRIGRDRLHPAQEWNQLTYVSGSWIASRSTAPSTARRFERTVQGWADKTAHRRDFFFTAKLHQSFTHEASSTLRSSASSTLDCSPCPQRQVEALLAQFRYDFVDSPQTRQHLGSLVGHFPMPLPWCWSCGTDPGKNRSPWIS